ncbi:MAG: hypothetical protein QOF76_2401, partial [Solirubrobacteraceae bacterium]|nr:hypothetical protein [Solirubrobacteraceae bacterium]
TRSATYHLGELAHLLTDGGAGPESVEPPEQAP